VRARAGLPGERRAVRSLRADLVSGWWADRNRGITGLDMAGLGARLLVG
jgi:hypothetical protein